MTKCALRILGATFYKHGNTSWWFINIKNSRRNTIFIIKRTTTKSWGAQDYTLRTVYSALLEGKVMYAYNYVRLTKGIKTKLETLNKKAIWIITGLLAFTTSPLLKLDSQVIPKERPHIK